LLAAFAATHGRPAQVLAQAPGRVNLIGEHTDYNDGFVLPCAIGFGTWVAAAPRQDGRVRVLALDQDAALDEFALAAPLHGAAAAAAPNPWPLYVRGMAQVLQQAGWALAGADLAISGNVPQGAGLSSSAALEVALGQAWRQLSQLQGLDGKGIARLAQRAENEVVGCRCGIMDQLISACGEAGHALLIDCRSLQTQPVPVPAHWEVLILHSRVQRGLVDSAYNERRAQCEAAARHYGVAALRDLDLPALQAGAAGLDATVLRRARHIVTENARTLAAAAALGQGDMAALRPLMAASHASMRDDFAISHPAVDRLVDILATALGPEGGVRMTGGGFGGCVVALAPAAAAQRALAAAAAHYRSPEGLPATAWRCRPAPGARAQPLGPAAPGAAA
jgi:galactokinase